MSRRRRLSSAALLSGAVFLAIAVPATAAHAATTPQDVAYGITSGGNRLIIFDPTNPSTAGQGTPITGFGTGESAAAADTRPSNGALYVMTDDASGTGRLYVVNTTTYVATRVGSTTYSLGRAIQNGYHFDIDFDPVTGYLRVVGTDMVDLSVDADTGAVVSTDQALKYATGDVNQNATPRIAGAAYTGTAGATSTTLYDVDFKLSDLVRQGDVGGTPNAAGSGQLHTIGDLFPSGDETVGNLLGFDISGSTGTAYLAALTTDTDSGGTASSSEIFTVDLSTGAATDVGAVGSTVNADILETFAVGPAAVTPPPNLPEFGAPAVAGIGALAAGSVVVVLRRRRSA